MWVGTRLKNTDGFKLWYSSSRKGRNKVGILVDMDLRESVVDVRRMNDRLMAINLVVGELTLNVISAYAPQVGLDEEVKRNGGGTTLLDFAKAFEFVIANSFFDKRDEHLVTFRSIMAKTQIDYLLLRRGDKCLCKDCKVIPS
nr:uncharacterized protein LOC104103581 [Nicotiana tomentosiformis]